MSRLRIPKTSSKAWLPPLLPLVLWTLGIEIASRQGWIAEFIIPPPSGVLIAFYQERKELFQAFLETGSSALIGLIMSFVLGTLASAAMMLSGLLKKMFSPYAIFFQTVPIVSVAPLLVIWFGFGQPTVIASAFVVSVFPIIASTTLGFDSTDPQLVDLFRLYKASRWDRLFRLKLPFALPQIFSGLRIAAGLAVIGAVIGEFIGGGGLGSIVDSARTQQRIDLVFAAVLLSSFLGVLFVFAINRISKMVLGKWHISER